MKYVGYPFDSHGSLLNCMKSSNYSQNIVKWRNRSLSVNCAVVPVSCCFAISPPETHCCLTGTCPALCVRPSCVTGLNQSSRAIPIPYMRGGHHTITPAQASETQCCHLKKVKFPQTCSFFPTNSHKLKSNFHKKFHKLYKA